MGIVWLGVPPVGRSRRRMEFDGPAAVFEGAAFAFLCEQCEKFRPGLSASLDECGYRVIDLAAREELGWVVELLRQAVEGYPEKWSVADGQIARRETILQQLGVLAGIVSRARLEGRPVECWGE